MIQIKDKKFKKYLSSQEIQAAITSIAEAINKDYQGKDLVVLGILNGAFIFTSDLVKQLDVSPEISFLKLSSYQGEKTTGKVTELIGLDEDLEGKHILIVEDIVDTGNTLGHIISALENEGASSVKTASLFLKPDVYDKSIKLDYVGKEIPNLFVIGYGMDYLGHGRELEDLYQIED